MIFSRLAWDKKILILAMKLSRRYEEDRGQERKREEEKRGKETGTVKLM